MTKNGLVDSKQALELLGLYDPELKRKPNHKYIGYLVERNLLPRITLGPRTFKYEATDCLALLETAKTKGLSLTAKPTK